MNDDIKLGIIVGFGYGDSAFQTDVKDIAKALDEANKFIRYKTGKDIRLVAASGEQIRRKKMRHVV